MNKNLVALFLIFQFIDNLHAGQIKGRILDISNNEGIAGAYVTIKNLTIGSFTDINGNYIIENLSEGTYVLIAQSTGFEKSDEKLVTLSASGIQEVNFKLKPLVHGLSEVSIIGKTNKETDESASMSEKNAENIVNIVSAKTIDKSPDITVANVAQRVSGVAIDRSTGGQSQYAIIRGMEQRYNNTLINGIKIPSPDATSRFIPLDIIPADLLQRLEVTKALTADMEGDAIGGTINAIMKEAPDSLLVSVQLSTGYNQLFFNNHFLTFNKKSVSFKDPDQLHGHNFVSTQNDFNRENLNFTSRNAPPNLLGTLTFGNRFSNKKLGVLFSISNQNTYSGSRSVTNNIFINAQNTPQVTDVVERFITAQQNRLGINLKFDYAFNSHHKISFFNLYLKTRENQSRIFSDTLEAGNGRYGFGTGYVSVAQRSRIFIQEVVSNTLQGKHKFEKLSLDWSAVYSKATGQVPDMAEVSTYHTVLPNGKYFNNAQYLSNIIHTWQKNVDEDISGYFNVEYKPLLFDKIVSFKAGGLYRTKFRNNYQNDYNLKPQLDSSNKDPDYNNINTVQVFPYQPIGNPEFNSSNYTANEIINSFYFQSKSNFGNLNITAGIRYEITEQSNFNKIPIFPGYKRHYFNYSDFLPSVHFKYLIREQQNIRMSYFKSLSRPNYFEIVEYVIKGDDANITGNPLLKHTRAHNFDIRYELFSNNEDVFMAGLFYKTIIDPIERSLISNGGQKAITYKNFGTAHNYGFELVAIKYYGNIGISANYTFTNSQISSGKILYNPDSSGKLLSTFPLEKRPMQGQSKHIANISFLYRNEKHKLNFQISMLFQGKRISDLSFYYGQDFYQKNYVDLSFSLEKYFCKKCKAFIKLNNMLNTPNVLETRDNFFIQKYTYQQNYQGGIKFNI